MEEAVNFLDGVMAGQEAVRTVELPELQDLATAEQDMGPLLAGDWMMMISPFMSDLSSSSSAWWQEVLRVANECYQRWLNADPLERLRLLPEAPLAFSRAPGYALSSGAKSQAVPESLRGELIAQRRADSISIIFKVLKTYQPGSLAERSSLLKQLVDQRILSGIGEWLSSLRTWRRWLVRVTELRIQPPDPVLLLATLDKFAVVLGKISAQVSFRLQIARAALRVDVAPSPHEILQFADTLQAEGETVYHGGGASTKEVVKAKTMEVKDTPDRDYKPREPDREKGKGKGKGKSTAACTYFRLQEGAGVRLCS